MDKKGKKNVTAKLRGNSFPENKVRNSYDANEQVIVSDVLGSYTGVPIEGVQPEQDADDL